jgi:hypothetical protein
LRDELDIPVPASGPSYRIARQRGGMDANTKRLVLIAGGIGGALALLISGYSLSGLRSSGGIPVVEAPPGPIRVKPDKPGGLEVFGGDDSILTGTQDEKAEVAPAPEAPDPLGLKAQEAREQTDAQPAAPAVAAPDASPPAAAQMPVQPLSKQAAAGAATPSAQAVVAPVAPATVTARVAPPAAKPAGVAPAGVMQVQLAALSSQDAATAEWSRLAKKFPDLLGGKQPVISHVDRDGKTYYRLRTGGFSDTAQATAFCQQMRANGAACSIASF